MLEAIKTENLHFESTAKTGLAAFFSNTSVLIFFLKIASKQKNLFYYFASLSLVEKKWSHIFREK